MILRSAVATDAEAIGRIRVSAWQAAYKKFMPKPFLASLDPLAHLDSWRKSLAQPSDEFLVAIAEIDGAAVAFSVVVPPRDTTKAECLELRSLNVHPVYWRHGIGRSLTLRAIDAASSLACRSLVLWCIQGNVPARANYERCGFVPTGEERSSSALTGHPLHEVLYAKAL